MSKHLTFEVVTEADKISTNELTMLIRMMESLGHDATQKTKDAYGYREDGGFDPETLAQYKIALKERMAENNYTFFLLKDETGQTVALASGNAPHKADAQTKQLRLMNIAVSEGLQEQGVGTALLRRISHYAKDAGFERIVIPLSRFAQAKGNVALYQHIADNLGIGHLPVDAEPARPVDAQASQIELELKPKLFRAFYNDREFGISR